MGLETVIIVIYYNSKYYLIKLEMEGKDSNEMIQAFPLL